MRRLLALRHSSVALVAMLILAQGCGSDSTTTTTGGSISLSLTPTSATVQAGGSTQVSGTIVRTSFTGDVAIAVSGAPTGVSGTVNSAPTNGSNSASVTLNVASTATAGTYTMSVVASGSGISNATATFTLTITAATSFYTMSLNSSTQSIAQSGNGNTTLTFVRTNFTGNITPSVTGLPTGVTASFAPNPATANTSVMTLTVASTVTTGLYNLVVHSSASGLSDVTAPLALTITASTGGGSVRLDYSTCTGANIPIWVAYQDGSGTWTRATGTGNVYNFTISSAKGAFAVVTLSGAIYTTSVNFFSQAELSATTGLCATLSGKTVNGTVAGLGAGDAATLSMGSSTATATFGGSSAFALANVATGAQTFVGYRRSSTTPGTTDKAIIRANQNITSGGSLALADFGSAEAVSPSSATFTFSGGTLGDTFVHSMAYLTTAACVSNSLYSVFGNYVASATEYGIPTAQEAATDFHRFTMQETSGNSTRLATFTFHTFGAQSFALPAALPAGTITTPSGGIGVRRQIALTLPSDYSTLGFTYFDAIGNATSIFASALYLGGSAVTLAMPDFTSAGGYLAIYGPGSGALSTSLFASGGTGAACTEGATTKINLVSGTTN